MHGNIHHSHAIVPPTDFAERMAQHWTETLHLCASPALRTLWRIMADTFGTAIAETAAGIVSPWRVLQPPTGSGKSQGTCVYAAMQADANLNHGNPVGVLIVVRTIGQANEFVATINAICGRPVAIASHSESRPVLEQLAASDVLIITHSAYVASHDTLRGQRENSWGRMLTWRGGTRLLTIIDEALANAIENSKVTNEDLSQALAYINFLPKALQEEHRTQIAELERMRDIIAGISLKQDRTATWVWQSSNTSPIELDLGPLRSAMWQLRYDLIVMRRRNSDDRKRVAEIVDSTLHHAELIADQWAYYAQKGSDLSINSAALLVPLDVPGPVVLDATARANFLWKLLEERAEIVGGLPDGVRDYSSVTLHVARAPKLGKNSMVKHIERRWPRTISEMEKQLGPDRALLAVMHLDVEYKALTYKNHFQRFATAHWNAIDGKNKWADFDAALILGMPYRDQVWSTNVFCALQGPTDNDWLKEPRWQEFEDVRAVLEQRQLSVSIIQAINRICCRRVVDDAGRCPPCDIYILLPSNETGDAILADINADMPGLVVTDWAFELDGPQVRRVRSGSSHDALLAFMSSVLPGKIAMSSIGKELGLSSSGLTKLREALRDASHPTTQALAGMGVSYASRGRGPGAASYLVKADR